MVTIVAGAVNGGMLTAYLTRRRYRPAPPTISRVTSNTERMAAGDWYITDQSVLEIQRERQTVMEL